MKKIFAIALAVVMVLSMASAFALSECMTWGTDWSCDADNLWCGQGKVEVVPYVKVNTSCGWEYQVSECATAIKTSEVFWAIKLTVDAYPDPAWWEEAVLDLESEGLINANYNLDWVYEDGNWEIDFSDFVNLDADGMMTGDFLGIDHDADEEKVYYLIPGAGFIDVEDDDFDLVDVMFEARVAEYDVCDPNAVHVCAELSSYYNGYRFDAFKPYNVAGDYFFEFGGFDANGDLNGTPDWTAKGEMNGWFRVWTERKNMVDEEVFFVVEEGAIKVADWFLADAAFYNKVLADFGLANCGTAACITKKNIEANFGWDDEQEDCFAWSDKGMAVVDTDCVVAIPKTGDASVLAWLF